jgi:hypothetical protein
MEQNFSSGEQQFRDELTNISHLRTTYERPKTMEQKKSQGTKY